MGCAVADGFLGLTACSPISLKLIFLSMGRNEFACEVSIRLGDRRGGLVSQNGLRRRHAVFRADRIRDNRIEYGRTECRAERLEGSPAVFRLCLVLGDHDAGNLERRIKLAANLLDGIEEVSQG